MMVITSNPRSAFPGDLVHMMKQRHRSAHGHWFDSGTLFTPLRIITDHRGKHIQVTEINGVIVDFIEDGATYSPPITASPATNTPRHP